MGEGWSVAWRVHDAQFWGVPQRRKRIALVADFGGQTAPEILFERESVSGDITESKETGKESTGEIEDSIGTAIYDVRISSDGTKNWRAHAYRTDITRNLDTGGTPDSNHGGCAIIERQ
jgi:DNA (cytosine-5)-methyltransferase 1